MIKTRTLAQMHNRPTSYQIEAVLPDGSRHHLGFTVRKTREQLIAAAATHAELLAPWCTDENYRWKHKNGTLTLAPGLLVQFSGRTERDIASEQERGK